MTTCAQQKYLAAALLGELDQAHQEALCRHLDECPACAAEWRSLSELQTLLEQRVRPQVPRPIYRAYVNELQRRFAPTPVWRTVLNRATDAIRKLFASPLPVFRLSRALALLVVGALIGRTVFFPPKPLPQTAAVQADEDVRFLNAFLSRSEVLLLTIVNAPVDSMRADDAVLNRELARALLLQAQQAQRMAVMIDDDMLPALMTHLELVLLEVSNRNDEEYNAALADLRTMIREARLVQAARQVQSRLLRSTEMGV
mgnify:CR=1 FL=1